MKDGIEGASVGIGLPFSATVNAACIVADFSPILCYAVAWRETIEEYGSGAAGVLADNGDGGHGLMQITPEDWWSAEMTAEWDALAWQDAPQNVAFALKWFLLPALSYWAPFEQGEALVKCVAAEYNAGRSAVIAAHAKGNVDLATTNGYAEAVLGFYLNLASTGKP